MNASDQMLLYVALVREGAKSAEDDYDNAAYDIQRKSERSIDLFGGTAVSQVAELATMSKEACENLYIAYQTLIRMLDDYCRPLLVQNAGAGAVRAVLDLIEWLNEESKIENNFTASLNRTSLGDVAAIRYFPTMDNRMIEQFWRQKYLDMPDRAAYEEELRNKDKAEKLAKAKKIKDEKDAAAEAQKRLAKVQKECKRREEDFRDALDIYIDEQREQLSEESVSKLEKQAETASAQYEKQMKEYLKNRFPVSSQDRYIGDKKKILKALKEISSGTINDIVKAGNLDCSSQRVSALTRQLVLDGYVNRAEIARMTFFEINESKMKEVDKLISQDTSASYEDTSYTDENMPVAPDPETVLKA